jgi:hypothetical protein
MTMSSLSSFQTCLHLGIVRNDFRGGGCMLKCRRGTWRVGQCRCIRTTYFVGGGGHAFGCRYRHRRCCVATTGTGATTTLLSLPSPARAVFLCARVVSGRRRQRVPTWLLLGCCLYLLSSSSFLLLSSLFPTPHPFLPISLFRARIERVGNLAFGLAQGRWWWWVGWTNRHRLATWRWRCDTR